MPRAAAGMSRIPAAIPGEAATAGEGIESRGELAGRAMLVGLAGQPNVGKSTLFSRLTGASLETGNWPGKTVERREGRNHATGRELRIVDLPGTYTLSAASEEERIARDFVLGERPDVVALVVDASNLERGLYLLADLLLLPSPVVVALNMTDVAERSGVSVDAELLARALGVPVVPLVARQGTGVAELAAAIARRGEHKETLPPVTIEIEPETAALLQRARALVTPYIRDPYTPSWTAHKVVEGDAEIVRMVREWLPEAQRAELDALSLEAPGASMSLAGARYAWAGRAARAATAPQSGARPRRSWTDLVDRVALHPVLGILLLLAVSFGAYRVTLDVSGPLQDLMDAGITGLAGWLGVEQGSLADGLFNSVGLLLVFLPVLAVFFLVFALLEDSGYMARAAFVLDRFLSLIGLRGKSFLPMFVGAGCNVPAVFGTRVIESRSARLLTILLLPLVPCSARLVVLALLVPAFFAAHAASVSVGLIALNIAVIALLGLVLSRTMFRNERITFVMELPRYAVPSLHTLVVSVWTKLLAFLRSTGTMIVVIAMAVWLLSNYPDGPGPSSYLARAGRYLEPLGAPMDMEWPLLVAIVTGFIAKEVVIATLGVLYGTASEESLVTELTSSVSPATALAFLVITMLFIPCVGTVAAMRREAGTKWMLFGAALLLVVSWGAGIVVYQFARAGGLG